MNIRVLSKNDDLVALTEMLHRAYAPLAARGLRYSATHQSAEVTARRLRTGHPLVAEFDGRIVGTVTIYRPDSKSRAAVYREPTTYSFGQFGVEPEFQGLGVGRALHQAAEEYGRTQGAQFMSLDTAAPATDLIATYERWGYSIAERVQWSDTNYDSVIMRRPLLGLPGETFGA